MIKLDIAILKLIAGRRNKHCQFGWNVTKDGIPFCHPNCVREFPTLFKTIHIQYIHVDHQDVFDETGTPWIDPIEFLKNDNNNGKINRRDI